MKMRAFLFLCCALAVSVCPAFGFELTILHVNDSHSYLESTGDTLTPEGKKTYVQLGAWARLATAVQAARKERNNTILLHAGDAVQGGLYFQEYNGKPEMEFLDRLGFDAYTLGNHEFDKGADFLGRFLQFTHVPVLSANLDATRMPTLVKEVVPYTILEVGDERVGVIGLTLAETTYVSSPGPHVSFADEAKTAQTYVDLLAKLGVNKIVLLTHVGLERDRMLAETVRGVDVIVGGHSHTLLANPEKMEALGQRPEGDYPVVVKGADGHDVFVVTAWKWGRVLGRIDLSFDGAGRVVHAHGAPVMLVADDFKRKDASGQKRALTEESNRRLVKTIDQSGVARVIGEDGASLRFLAPYAKGVKAMMEDVIGTAEKSLPHIRVPGVTESGISLPNGSLVAPLVAQSMLDKVNTTGRKVDLVLINGGGVRMGLSQGNITVGDVNMMMPFGNTIFTMHLTGEQIKAALEYGVSRGRGAFPYVAGASYAANMNRPEGKRVHDVAIHGIPLDPAQQYRLATNAYLARGGDGYDILKQGKDTYDTGFIVSQAFMEYVTKTGTLSPLSSTSVSYTPEQ